MIHVYIEVNRLFFAESLLSLNLILVEHENIIMSIIEVGTKDVKKSSKNNLEIHEIRGADHI